MRVHPENVLPWALIVIGILLRFTDLAIPDFATDEAQATLGATAAWTPAGMLVFRVTQAVFGHTIFVARGTSAIFGIALLPVIYALAMLYGNRRFALLATAIAAIFPSHILFSRLAYLSAQLAFAWALTLLAFLKAKRQHAWIFILFGASCYASLIKTQAGLFPFALLLGRIIERRKDVLRDDIAWTLVLGLIPAAFYIVTHPGIAATLLLYGGNMYGTSGFMIRAMTLVATWWHVLLLFLPAMVMSIMTLRAFGWPLSVFLFLAAAMGFFLGPAHEYYATELVLSALPIAALLSRQRRRVQESCMTILLITTLALLGPRDVLLNRWTLGRYQVEGYWNTHADAINATLAGEDAVTVLGVAGHHLRWYLEPRVLVGRNMDSPYLTNDILVIEDRARAQALGEVVYDDGVVTIARQLR